MKCPALLKWRRKKHPQLPLGLPKGFPHNTTPEDLAERPERIVVIGSEQLYAYPTDNSLKTSIYTVLTFIPKFLAVEFHPTRKVANVFFLVVCAMQCIPAISNTFGVPVMLLPLLFVVLVDASFAIVDDVKRHRSDDIANSSAAVILDRHIDCACAEEEALQGCGNPTWRTVRRWEIRVGDVVLVKNREELPADMVVLAVHEEHAPNYTGVCYVETKSLDGETSLKQRRLPNPLIGVVLNPIEAAYIVGQCNVDHPNKRIHRLRGGLRLTKLPGASEDVEEEGEKDMRLEPLNATNVLLRGEVLRSCEWCVGLVIATGHQTKIMMAMATAREKPSTLTLHINKQIKYVGLLLVSLCLLCGALSASWVSGQMPGAWYLDWQPNNNDLAAQFLIDSSYYILLLYGSVPISLYISQSFVRFFQSMFMQWDLTCYTASTDTPLSVRSSGLNEELGQISHLLTDKTGTLTDNVMVFRGCVIDGKIYGGDVEQIRRHSSDNSLNSIPILRLDSPAAGASSRPLVEPRVKLRDKELCADLKSGGVRENKCRDFFRCLALCHSVIIEPATEEGEEGGLSASSADEEALVLAARYFGVAFIGRPLGFGLRLAVHNAEGKVEIEDYELLHELPFDPARRRMSVLVRRSGGGENADIRLITKGADAAIIPILNSSENGDHTHTSDNNHEAVSNGQEVNGTSDRTRAAGCSFDLLNTTIDAAIAMSHKGLRIFFVAACNIEAQRYRAWEEKYREALASAGSEDHDGTHSAVEHLVKELEETSGLELIGATAVEDRLQEGCGETISLLSAAGITVWMITGDKEETAINIASSCMLLPPESEMERVLITKTKCSTPTLIRDRLHQYLAHNTDKMKHSEPMPCALIIDGMCLAMLDGALFGQGVGHSASTSPIVLEARTALSKVLAICSAVVACRTSPDQKRALVSLAHAALPHAVVLAVGDGSNDVPMIQAAEVGVGILGKEGRGAANASDFSIGQFKHLGPLLLVHGRYNLRRMTILVLYIFYKSAASCGYLLAFAAFTGMSGPLNIDIWQSSLWALIYTSLPIILLGAADRDVLPAMALATPQLYRPSRIGEQCLDGRAFWWWLSLGWMESAWCLLVGLLFLWTGDTADNGATASGLQVGNCAFSAITLCVNAKMCTLKRRWHWFEILILIVSSLLLWGFGVGIGATFTALDWEFIGLQAIQNASKVYWLAIFFAFGGVFMRDIAWTMYRRWYRPTMCDIMIEIEKKHGLEAAIETGENITAPPPEPAKQSWFWRRDKWRKINSMNTIAENGNGV